MLMDDSTVILFLSQRHDDQYGPKSAYGRQLGSAADTGESATTEDKVVNDV